MEESKKNPEPAAGENAPAEQSGQPVKKKTKEKRLKTFFSDFKKFISKGNIIDLAVAVVIGAAFGAIVTALVADFIMPLITLVTGGGELSDLKWQIKPPNPDTGAAGVFILWGDFLQKIIDFILIAFFIFLALRILVNAKKGISKQQKLWLKKIKRNPALAENPPEDVKDEVTQAVAATENSEALESSEDILKDIRGLLKLLAEKNAAAPDTTPDNE